MTGVHQAMTHAETPLSRRGRLLDAALFLALLFTVLALGGALAHGYSLPNKLKLSRDDYFIAQRAYDGWWMLVVFLAPQLLSLLAVAALSWRRQRNVFWCAAAALLAYVGAQVVFFLYTQPANAATNNWTVQPENWETLRRQWEYSHLSGAIFQLTAMVMLIFAALSRR
jgi:hypothetical protein